MKSRVGIFRVWVFIAITGYLLTACAGSEASGTDTVNAEDILVVVPDSTMGGATVDSGGGIFTPPQDTGAGNSNPAADVAGPENVTPQSGEVDPECVDGQYSETLPTPTAPIDDLIAAYSPAAVVDFILGVLDRRYPVGSVLIDGGLAAKDSGFGLGDCIEQFLYQRDTANQVISSLSTLVHECGHFYDLSLGGFAGAAFVFTPDTKFTCQGGSIPDFGGKTFARSLILGDEYAQLHKPCATFRSKDCEDSYAPIYLDGDPDNGNFESGDQGFDMLLEEVVQYVNSLITDYAFSEFVGGSISARDGILTFLWYMERYLRMARLDYPEVYAHLTTDSCWRSAILTAWGRAWLYLDLTEGMNSLGIDDAKLIGLVRAPELLEEIERVRDAEGCP